MSEDRCVMCGEIIPEGSWVCPICVKNAYKTTCEDCGRVVYTKSYSTKRCKICSKEHEREVNRKRVARWRKG